MKTAIATFALLCNLIFWGSADAQTITNTPDPTVAFRYDGFEDSNDAPATISKERLQDDQIMIKTYRYSLPLNGKIGLPSMEDIREQNVMDEVIEANKVHLPLIVLTSISNDSITANLIRDDTKDGDTALLINPEWY